MNLSEIQSILVKENLLREVVVGDQWYYRLEDEKLLDQSLTQIDYQSNRINQEAIFVCKGKLFKEEYLVDAVSRGAQVYVSEVPYENVAIPGFIVSDIRRAMPILAAAFYQNPQKDLTLIGITGTKGKTTTNYFLRHILDETYPGQTAFISSINTCLDGKNEEASDLTTPEAIDLFQMFAAARDNHMTYFIMEVSSQAYKMDRVYGIQYDLGLFTNFSPDHIGENEHPNMEDYFFCKRQFLNHVDWVLLYDGLPHLDLLVDQLEDHQVAYEFFGETNRGHQLIPSKEKATIFELIGQNGDSETYESPMPGLFNLENAAGAAVIAQKLGASPEDIQNGLSKTDVDGRMDRYELPNGAVVYVDYAHNYDSLKRMLEYIQAEYPGRKSTLVIGAPGGKGLSRRKVFAEIADEYMDQVIFTEEDPNYEDPTIISEEMKSYLRYPEKCRIINDRQEAVEEAVKNATKDDVVIITGKGREQYQKVKGQNIFYKGDTYIVEEYLK